MEAPITGLFWPTDEFRFGH